MARLPSSTVPLTREKASGQQPLCIFGIRPVSTVKKSSGVKFVPNGWLLPKTAQNEYVLHCTDMHYYILHYVSIYCTALSCTALN